jgi:hypothetical protein
MSQPLKPCPGCGKEPFIECSRDSEYMRLECNECSFRAEESDWNRRTPGPATAKLIRCIKADLEPTDKMLDAFLAEWAEPATSDERGV